MQGGVIWALHVKLERYLALKKRRFVFTMQKPHARKIASVAPISHLVIAFIANVTGKMRSVRQLKNGSKQEICTMRCSDSDIDGKALYSNAWFVLSMSSDWARISPPLALLLVNI